MCDKLQLGCVVVEGGTVRLCARNRFLTSQPCHAMPAVCRCDVAMPAIIEDRALLRQDWLDYRLYDIIGAYHSH
jgi:hypothetical protein